MNAAEDSTFPGSPSADQASLAMVKLDRTAALRTRGNYCLAATSRCASQCVGRRRKPATRQRAVAPVSGKFDYLAMPEQSAPPYEVKVRPCHVSSGRWRWEVLSQGRSLLIAPTPYADKKLAEADGKAALDEMLSKLALDTRSEGNVGTTVNTAHVRMPRRPV